ncbi:protein of unknown function; putative exported protein [Methylorubrum extorquens DM4]|uniref:Uncharacterized protein n=2 Tax=Methylorubrum extorquens TaxID=408 RepID=C5APX2_METEA|nr:hypothetical protein; putative exported protein [Methylorubrum extorquens AM1]CAX24650.1 protein of unknown function; putative exported protein [Methylorubrum extorquens DM4]
MTTADTSLLAAAFVLGLGVAVLLNALLT